MPATGTQTGRSAAVEKKLKAKKKAAPKPAPKIKAPSQKVKVQQAKAQAKTYGSPAASRRAAQTNRKVAKRIKRQRQAEARRKLAPKNQFKATQRKQQKAIAALADLRASDPEYAHKLHAEATGEGRKNPLSIIGVGPKRIEHDIKAAKGYAKLELEGKGVISKGLNKLAEAYTSEHAKLVPGTKKSPKMASALPGSAKIAANAAKDAITFPAQAIPSLYVPAAAAYEAAKGDTSRGEKLIEDVKQTDPIYNTIAAGVEKAKGNEKAAKSHLAKAKKSATEHPGLTALEVAGVKGGVGRFTSRTLRGTGRTVRATGRVTGSKTVERAGERVRKAGSTERAPRRVPGTNIVEERAYSRDSFTKARQVNQERAARKKRKRLLEEADRAEKRGFKEDAEKKRADAANLRHDPDRAPNEQEIKRQVDEDVQVREDIRRINRSRVVKQTRKILRSAKREKGALSVVAQRIARADKSDLKAYISELEHEAKTLRKAPLRANQKLRDQLQKVVDDPKADMARLENAARAYEELTGPLQRRLGELRVVSPKQAEIARRIPYAIRREGARVETEPRLSQTGVRKFITKEQRRVADRETKKAQKRVVKARKALADAVASARVSVASRKSSTTLKNAERELRAAQAELGRTRRGEHAQARRVAVRKSKAERRRIQTERSFLRSNKKYRQILGELNEVNTIKRLLRQEQRISARFPGMSREAIHARMKIPEHLDLSEHSWADVSKRSRELAAHLESHAKSIMSKPLIRTIKSGPNKGKKVITGRARVKRAERRELAPEATMTKPSEAITRAKERVARAERAVATERKRIRGVDPARHDRLLRAIEQHDRAKDELARARENAKIARATHIAAKEAGKGKKDKIIPGLVDEHGRPLPVDVVRQLMVDEGEPAFLTQAPSRRGARNYFITSSRPQGIPNRRRTGEATRRGTFDADPETLPEGAAHAQGLVDAVEGFRDTIHHFALRDKDGDIVQYKTKDRADQEALNQLHHPDGSPDLNAVPMRAVRLQPFGGTKQQLENLLDDVNKLSTDQRNAISKTLSDALDPSAQGDGPWTLIPEAAAERIQEHLNTMGGGGGIKTVQIVNQMFRRTVLSTSLSWMAGNIIEASLRSALAHAGPRSWWTSRQVYKRLKEIDPKAADELMSRVLGGGHYSSQDRSFVSSNAERFKGTKVEPIANALGAFWRAPGPKLAADFWHRYTQFVFGQLNGRIEKNFQQAMLGVALRKSPLMDQRIVKLQKAAYDEAARGLSNTSQQIKFGREVDIMYGKYAKLSPSMKKMVSTYTPFISWWVNSVYFVYRTLPRDHPVVTGLIASAEMATEEWRKEHGLDQFIEGQVPGFLQGSIPTPGGGKFRASRFTPFGAFGDPGGTLAAQLTPLFSSPAEALQGRDWTGRELRIKNDDGSTRKANALELLMFAGHSFLQGTIPGLALGERIKKGGPGAINPFKITKPPEPKSSSGNRKVRKSRSSGGSIYDSGGSSGSGGGSIYDSGGSGFSSGGSIYD